MLKPWMMGSSIPGPSSTIPSGPSECHGRPPTPSPYPENKLMRRCTWQYTYWVGNKLRNHSYSSYKSDNYLDDTRNVQVRRERWGDTRVSGSSRDEKSPSSSFNKESSTLPLDAKHVQAVPTLKAAEVRTITETLDEMPPSDPCPYCSIPSGSNACHTTSSAPTCVSGSTAIKSPSLMSIQKTPAAKTITFLANYENQWHKSSVAIVAQGHQALKKQWQQTRCART